MGMRQDNTERMKQLIDSLRAKEKIKPETMVKEPAEVQEPESQEKAAKANKKKKQSTED